MDKRVLQLCHKIPYPPVDGGAIAMHQMTEFFLKHGFITKVVALNTCQTEFNNQILPADYRIQTRFEALDLDTRIDHWRAFINLFSNKSYNVERFYSKVICEKLSSILDKESFDFIQLEGLYLTPYIPVIRKKSRAAIIFRAHNIEHLIWKGLAASARNPILKTYLNLLAYRLEKYELSIMDQVDALMAISTTDHDFFRNNGFKGSSVIAPVMVPEVSEMFPLPETEPGTVFHLGAMDWRPNREGILWFLKEVWPRVLKKAPEMKFYLAGKGMPARFFDFSGKNNVTVFGEVPNAVKFMAGKQIMVVPLLSGSGMRVKIIEGMALGTIIVSTHVGAEGIGCRHNQEILLANTPEEMASAIVDCHRKTLWAGSIAANGSAFVKQHFSTDRIHKELLAFFNNLMLG